MPRLAWQLHFEQEKMGFGGKSRNICDLDGAPAAPATTGEGTLNESASSGLGVINHVEGNRLSAARKQVLYKLA